MSTGQTNHPRWRKTFHVGFNYLSSAGISEHSMGAGNCVGTELSYWPASLCSLAGQYDNPIPSRFLSPIDSLKITAL
jgi:hypothetical protein